jgi:Flp pilus assembly protein TadG
MAPVNRLRRPAVASPRRRGLASERGAELIEFALVLPVLLVVVAGILDMGFLFKDWEVVTNAAREGARAAALPGWVQEDVEERVNKYIAGGGLEGEAVTTVAPVTVTVGGRAINAVKVTVSYPHTYLVLGPIVQMIQGSVADITLKAAATMRTEMAAGL